MIPPIDMAHFPMGSARSSFVASVGRKVADMQRLVAQLSQPAAAAESLSSEEWGDFQDQAAVGRGELRRKLHALGAGARSLKLDGLERAVADAIGLLDRSQNTVHIDLVAALDRLPAHANSAPVLADRGPRVTAKALWFGSADDATSLGLVGSDGLVYACDYANDAGAAFDFVRDGAVEIVVIDADTEDAYDLACALLDDPATDATPLVVYGSFTAESDKARFLALGPSAVVTKAEGELALRHACDEARCAANRNEPAVRPLGTLTVAELAERLSDELRTELAVTGDPAAAISFDVGTDVLAPLWGAVARIRESIAARTHGGVTFRSTGPLGAHFIAPSVDNIAPHDARTQLVAGSRAVSKDVDLTGRRILVVDDDPAVTWFVADVFRSAGCVVDEALDGETALLRAYANPPDLIITDVLMPKMDGISLCRVLRKDVLLRDRPIIVLSWKEDLLQRVRELGMPANGFLRKESDDLTLLANARELLRSVARIEGRVRGKGEVRGRLDGVCATTLLGMIADVRPSARVTIRDASFLYEVNMEEGLPVSVTRSTGDGTMLRGESALASLLGVSAGRFWVANAATVDEGARISEGVFATLVGERRRVLRALGLHDSSSMGRLLVDQNACADFLKASPPAAATIVSKIMAGEAPKQLLLSGVCDVLFLEETLSALAVRGAIRGVEDTSGYELSIPIVLPDFSALEVDGELRSALPPAVALERSVVPPAAEVVISEVNGSDDVVGPSLPASLGALELALEAEPPSRLPPSDQTDVDMMPEVKSDEAGRVTTNVDHTLYGGADPTASSPSSLPLTRRSGSGNEKTLTPSSTTARPGDAEQDSLRSVSVRVEGSTEESGPSQAPPPMSRDASIPPKAGVRMWHTALVFAGAVAAGVVLMQSLGQAPQSGSASAPPATQDFGDQPTITYKNASAGEEGKVEIALAKGSVRIDGTERGTGPNLTLVLPPGAHRIDQGEGRPAWSFEVRAGSIARVRLPSEP